MSRTTGQSKSEHFLGACVLIVIFLLVPAFIGGVGIWGAYSSISKAITLTSDDGCQTVGRVSDHDKLSIYRRRGRTVAITLWREIEFLGEYHTVGYSDGWLSPPNAPASGSHVPILYSKTNPRSWWFGKKTDNCFWLIVQNSSFNDLVFGMVFVPLAIAWTAIVVTIVIRTRKDGATSDEDVSRNASNCQMSIAQYRQHIM